MTTKVILGDAEVTGVTEIGNATSDTWSVYGVTPVDQPASANQAVYTQTAVTDISGHNTTAIIARINQVIDDLTGLNTLVTSVRAALVSTGVIKGAA